MMRIPKPGTVYLSARMFKIEPGAKSSIKARPQADGINIGQGTTNSRHCNYHHQRFGFNTP